MFTKSLLEELKQKASSTGLMESRRFFIVLGLTTHLGILENLLKRSLLLPRRLTEDFDNTPPGDLDAPVLVDKGVELSGVDELQNVYIKIQWSESPDLDLSHYA